jgi:hypothetical protein
MRFSAVERIITLSYLWSTLGAAPFESSSNWYLLSFFPVIAS